VSVSGIKWGKVSKERELKVFRGINSINMDGKWRIAIPMRYRQCLLDDTEGRLILTIDTEQRCLLVYPLPTWEQIEQEITKLPSFHPATRRIQRLLMGHATELTMDTHGRILLPQLLREYADLDKKVILLGQGNKFEIWSDEHWQQSREKWLSHELIKENELPEELKAISL
jgi:MraZ protein